MRPRAAIFLVFAVCATWGVLLAQKPFHDYTGEVEGEYAAGVVPIPPDYDRPAEWTRARLKYTKVGILHPEPHNTGRWGWATDYPLGDRHFMQGITRLTMVDAKSVEQVVELDGTDDIYNFPFLYAVEVGHWHLFQDEADQLREYLARGGFLMTDDFHGTIEWENFMKSLQKVFPTKPPVDMDNREEIFHVLYDLDSKVQIPGAQFLRSGVPYEFDGFTPKWRAIYDDKGRVVMGICHNMDISDAIENSDDPQYPEKWASMAYRISANYVIYDLTH
ncbi:MAG: DUF4159 domain-containing protein [Acidobacteriota bacterium]